METSKIMAEQAEKEFVVPIVQLANATIDEKRQEKSKETK